MTYCGNSHSFYCSNGFPFFAIQTSFYLELITVVFEVGGPAYFYKTIAFIKTSEINHADWKEIAIREIDCNCCDIRTKRSKSLITYLISKSCAIAVKSFVWCKSK